LLSSFLRRPKAALAASWLLIWYGFACPGLCQSEGVHGSGVHGGIRRDSWKAFHVVVPSGIVPRDWLLYPALLLRGQDGIFMDLSSCCRFGAGFRGHGDYRGAPMGACHCRRKASFAW
jgi:hypothetical protein